MVGLLSLISGNSISMVMSSLQLQEINYLTYINSDSPLLQDTAEATKYSHIHSLFGSPLQSLIDQNKVSRYSKPSENSIAGKSSSSSANTNSSTTTNSSNSSTNSSSTFNNTSKNGTNRNLNFKSRDSERTLQTSNGFNLSINSSSSTLLLQNNTANNSHLSAAELLAIDDKNDPTYIYNNSTIENNFNEQLAERKSPYFVVNGIIIIFLNFLAWILSVVSDKVAHNYPKIMILWTIRNIFHSSAPIFIYFVTTSDFFLYFFYQMQFGNIISQINQISVFMAGFVALYWIGVFIWLFLSINFGNIFEKQENKL